MDAEARLTRIEATVERLALNRPRLDKTLATLREAQAKLVEHRALREAREYVRNTQLDSRIDRLVKDIDGFIRMKNERNT